MPDNKTLAFALDSLLQCTGYLPKFINNKTNVSLGKILKKPYRDELPEVKGNSKGYLHYNNFTVLYNSGRKVPTVVAYNIDGNDKANQSPRPTFQADPRIKEDIQLDNAFYDLRKDITEFEIGHMASNNEMGRGVNGIVKAFQTFHFVNSVPQAERLNTGLWKGLESYVIREAARVKDNKRICVFTGPVLTPGDPAYVNMPSFQIPLLFFKVIVFLSPKGLYSTAFLMSHEKRMIEQNMFETPPLRGLRGGPEEAGFFIDFPYRQVFQVNIPFLENQTGLNFTWRGVKQLDIPMGKSPVNKIHGIDNAKEAKAAITRGEVIPRVTTPVTEKDLKEDRYITSMILP